jgi:hypothetical protein
MGEIINGIELDEDNVEFSRAADFVQSTNKLVYLTGKAGTGKTTFLKYIKSTTQKSTVVLAPTGVAAINAGGQTIHSFFKLPFSPFVPNDARLGTTTSEHGDSIFKTFRYHKDKVDAFRSLELLIIDEVSMVRVDIIDVIDRILRVFRQKPQLPFGGVQVILIGDAFQLSPIAKGDEWAILNQFYKTPFFFSAIAIQENKPVYIELKKIYRQKEQEFIDLLNRVRTGEVNHNDLKILEDKYDPTFENSNNDHIILATTNASVYATNTSKLQELPQELYTYNAKITGDFPQSNMPTEQTLELKVGAQIMMIKNDPDKRFYNGKIGKVAGLAEDSIQVELKDGDVIGIKRETWENRKFVFNKEKKKIEEEIIGSFEQFPVRLAWAITVHKSQGLTFERVYADIGSSFATGQVYVALSRCTSFNGLKLKSRINRASIMVHNAALEFAKEVTPDTLLNSHLSEGKADFLYKEARQQFKNGDFHESFETVKKALNFRNDLETEQFSKFIRVYSQQLLSPKKLKVITNRFRESNDFFVNFIKNKNSELKSASEINEKQLAEIHTLKSSIHQLEGYKNELKKVKSALARRDNTLINQKEKLEKANNDIVMLLRRSGRDQDENTKLKEEIKRLNSISWLDRLLGKK